MYIRGAFYCVLSSSLSLSLNLLYPIRNIKLAAVSLIFSVSFDFFVSGDARPASSVSR